MIRLRLLAAAFAGPAALLAAAPAAVAQEAAMNACIDQIRTVGGSGAQAGGEVVSSNVSGGVATMMLRDGGGTTWECVATESGELQDLRVVEDAEQDEAPRDPKTEAARAACRDALRERRGEGGISVMSAEFSEANTLVMLRRRHEGNAVMWRCLSSNSGEVAELTRAE